MAGPTAVVTDLVSGKAVPLSVDTEGPLSHQLLALQQVVNDTLSQLVTQDSADMPDEEALDSDDEKQLEAEIAALEQPTKRPRSK